MKNKISNKVKIIVFALFNITLLYTVLAVEGKGINWKPVAELNIHEFNARVRAVEDPERDEWQKPDEVVKYLNLKPGDIIADIGAGDGYFTKRLARAVGPEGQALGLDVVSSKVELMRKDAERLGLNNYKALLIKSNDSGLEPGSVDVVFLCNTYHHLDNRVDYMKRLSMSLKRNGRVIIIDFYKKPMPVGPSSLDHKLSRDVVLEELRKAGYKLLDDKDLLPYQYYLEFGL